MKNDCDHQWIFVGRNKYGEYWKCKLCGAEEEA